MSVRLPLLTPPTPAPFFLQDFATSVLEDLWKAIVSVYPPDEEAEEDLLASERSYQNTFLATRSRCFVGRRNVLRHLHHFVEGDDLPSPFVVHGDGGSGKSAVLAKYALFVLCVCV